MTTKETWLRTCASTARHKDGAQVTDEGDVFCTHSYASLTRPAGRGAACLSTTLQPSPHEKQRLQGAFACSTLDFGFFLALLVTGSRAKHLQQASAVILAHP